MLAIPRIKNVATIESTEIRFEPGLNILSGETGAGKSIILEAISLLLGSRATLSLIRSGCEESVIEGVFDISQIPWMADRLIRHGFDESAQELLIKRSVHRGGRHRITVNGELATLTTLHQLCEGLIDLCGQHEHQSLLKAHTQLDLLDRYGGLSGDTKTLEKHLLAYKKLHVEKESLQQQMDERRVRSDFLAFQINEIKEAQLEPEEDEKLQQEKQLLQSSENRMQLADAIRAILEEEDQGAIHALRLALQKIRILENLDPTIQPMMESLERAAVEAEDVCLSLNRYLSSIELDPERLPIVQDRLSLIANLRRKYGATIPKIHENLRSLETELTSLEQMDCRIEQLNNEIEKAKILLLSAGKKLSQQRKKVSERLARLVTAELKDLKMDDAHFKIELTLKENLLDWNAQGGDSIQYVVQTNRGEVARPLGRIASGGELSRLMLAIRRVISDSGGIGVYLFDEIDAGMGGQTAFQVGKKLKSVASYNQVICITHLPQVASFAHHHLVVQKSVSGNRTLTLVRELNQKERKEELARMLGGPDLTKTSLQNASELMALAFAP